MTALIDIPTHESLKAYQRERRDSWSEGLSLRVHRALSWLNRAHQCEDPDGAFIFLWVAFNAAYANEVPSQHQVSEGQSFSAFLGKLVALDTHRMLHEVLWTRYAQSVRLLLSNRHVYQPFWDHLSDARQAEDWDESFRRFQRAAHQALANGDTAKLLGVIFSSLYTLRNQLIHGGATWGGSVNREQVRVGAQIMGDLVPLVIQLMMQNADALWGDPRYPVVRP